MGWTIRQVDDKRLQRAVRKIFTALIASLVFGAAALAQTTITPDNNTATTVSTTGNVTDINTTTVTGATAYNSFNDFNVGQGDVVNLYLPSNTTTLLNLINSSQMTVNGMLNSIENGQIGGNVFFADPYGMVVGSTGVVNVGSFTALTPTTAFMNSFFTSADNPDAAEANALLNGTAPSADGPITINGTINALTDISLAGGAVSNSGIIQSGAVFASSSPDFSDVVNANGIQNGSFITVQNGNISIQASGDFENAGTIATNGSPLLNAGNVNIQAGGLVALDSNSLILANGEGQSSNGGDIILLGSGGGQLDNGAVVSATGGYASGDGGTIKFTALGTLAEDGGVLQAGAPSGTAGTATLSTTGPSGNLFIGGSDLPNDGTNLVLKAENSISVVPNVTISSRQIGNGTDALNSPSTGDSGNITFDAPSITIGNGASILANVESGSSFNAGDISIKATQSVTDGIIPPLPSISANAKINIGNATIAGGNITITADAEADANKTPNKMANQALDDTSLGDLIGSYGPVSYKAASATSNIAIGDSSNSGKANITGSGDVTIGSTASATSVSTVIGISGFAYGHTDSSATTSVASNATISATGNLSINSTSNNNLTVKESTATSSPAVIAVAYGNAVSSSRTEIGGTVSGDSVTIGATNTNNFVTEATDTPFSTTENAPKNGTGIGIALGFYKSTAKTNVTGSVTSNSGDAMISSKSTNLQDAVFSSSSLSTDSGMTATAAKYQSMVTNMGGFLSQGSFWPSKAAGEGQTGQLGLGAAVSYVKGSNAATTTVTGKVDGANNATISSDATDAPQVTAAGSVSGQSTGIGGAVAIGDYSNTAGTSVKGGAQVISVLGSASVTSTATMANPAVNRADLIAADQNFSGGLSGIATVVGDAVLGLGLIGNPGQFATSFVNAGISTQASEAGVQGDNVGLAASVAVLTLTNKSNASVTGDGTSVLAGYDSGGNLSASADGNVNIEADSSVTSFNAAGMGFSAGKVASLNPGVNSGSSLGGSANAVTVTNKSTADVGDKTTVKAASTGSDNGQVNVKSDTQMFEVALVQAGNKAENFGITGTLNYMDLTDSSVAFIQSNATVDSTNDVNVDATNNLLDIAVGGALGLGGSKQMDVAVNWNDVHQTTLAYIGDPSNARTSICTGCGVNAGGNVNVGANSTEHLYAVTFAAASSGNPPPSASDSSESSDEAPSEENGAGGGGYSFGVSGEIAINQAGSSSTDPGITTKAFINNGASVTATGDVNVKAKDSSRFVNAALALSVAGGEGMDGGVALAGGYDQNTVSKDVEAFTKNSTINADGLSINATGVDNLYAVTVGGAINTLDSGVAIAGAVNNDATYNNITADLGAGTSIFGTDGTSVMGSGGITVNAQEGGSSADQVVSAVGGFSGSASGGVGASVDIGNYNNTVTASIDNSKSKTKGNVQVTANTNVEYTPIAISFAAGADWGAAGSVAVENITDATKSSVGGTVTSGQNLLVGSIDSSSATMVAGAAGLGGSLGVGFAALVPDFSRDTTATIADYADVSAAGSSAAAINYDNEYDVGILLDASTSGDLKDYVVGGAGSKTVALGGSLIINQAGSNSLKDSTSATIGKHATVNGDDSNAATDQSVVLVASDNSGIVDVAGMLAVGGAAGVGVGYDQITPEWDVSTSIGSDSTVNAAADVILHSKLKNSIKSYAIVGAASAGEISASVTGATSVIDETSNVDSTVNGKVSAGSSVEVAAVRSTSSLDALDGNAAVAISLGAGVGVSLADITTNDTVDASISGTGDVTALGNSSLNLPNGAIDDSGTLATSSFRGVSVTAMSFMSSNPITAGVAASGAVGGQGSVLKDSYTETTQAHVDSGAKVNQTNDTSPNASQSVQVLATDKTKVDSIAGGLSLGAVALTASSDQETLNRTVNAFITAASVDAAENVLIEGSVLGSIKSTAVAGSLGGFAGDGAVSTINETTNANAYVDGGSVVTSNGNVEILANRNTSLTTEDGSLAVGGAGTNASVSTVTKNDTAAAYVDGSDTKVTALGNSSGLSVPIDSSGSLGTGTVKGLTIAAKGQETLDTNAIGASATIAGGATGSVTKNNITENTSAKVEGGATVNSDNTGADSSQGVNVLAYDKTKLTNLDGAYGIDFVGAGIGAGVDNGNIQKTTVAGIDKDTTVNAQGAVNVDALSLENINSHVAAVGGSLVVGAAGSKVDYSTNPIKPTTTAGDVKLLV